MTDADLLSQARNRQTLALVTWEPYMHNPKLKHRLHTIDCPTLLIRGAQDGLVSKDYVESYAGLIPGRISSPSTAPAIRHRSNRPTASIAEIERFTAA